MANQNSLLQALRSFAHAMGGGYDLSEMAAQLSSSITEVLSVTGAGVSVADEHGALRFITASDEQIVEIEMAQEKTQDGPCVDSFLNNEPVHVSDVRTDERWPTYSRTAADIGLHAVMGYPLTYEEQPIGAIDIYSVEKRDWSEEDIDFVGVFADMATAYLVRVSELAEARGLAEQLQGALDSRVLIEQAKGLLSGEHGISVDDAFATLRRHARNHNVKLADLCDAVVNKGLRIPTA